MTRTLLLIAPLLVLGACSDKWQRNHRELSGWWERFGLARISERWTDMHTPRGGERVTRVLPLQIVGLVECMRTVQVDNYELLPRLREHYWAGAELYHRLTEAAWPMRQVASARFVLGLRGEIAALGRGCSLRCTAPVDRNFRVDPDEVQLAFCDR